MPVVLVGAPENTTVVVSLLMVHRLASIPIKLVASFVGESPAPSVCVGVQTVVQSKPGTRFNFKKVKMGNVTVPVIVSMFKMAFKETVKHLNDI